MAGTPPRLPDGLLDVLGIAAVDTHDATTAALHAELTRHGIAGTVTQIRWGTATIRTDNSGAALLTWHRDRLEEIATRLSDGTVTKVRIDVHHTADPDTSQPDHQPDHQHSNQDNDPGSPGSEGATR